MNHLALPIGVVASLIGLAIMALTIVFLRKHTAINIITGIVFVVLGALIIWLNLQGSGSFHVNVGISNKQFGFILVGFVMSLFILKGVLDFREGSKNLQNKTLSSLQVVRSKLQIVVAVIVITFIVLILVVAFTHVGR